VPDIISNFLSVCCKENYNFIISKVNKIILKKVISTLNTQSTVAHYQVRFDVGHGVMSPAGQPFATVEEAEAYRESGNFGLCDTDVVPCTWNFSHNMWEEVKE
jgi:hypothetical protein